MLKTLLFITVAFFISEYSSFAQQYQHEDKIIEFYGQQRFSELQQSDPALLNLLDKYIDHGFYVKNVSPGKYSEFTPLQNIPLADKNGGTVSVSEFLLDFSGADFNPLKYAYFPMESVQMYKLDGVDKIIYILPYSSIILQ